MSVRFVKIYVVLIFCMLPILCMAEEDGPEPILIGQDSLAYLDIDYGDYYIYMSLLKYHTDTDPKYGVISDTLNIQIEEDADDFEWNNYADIGRLNDTTGLSLIQYDFYGRHYDHWWRRYVMVFVAVSPHKIRLVKMHKYYPEFCISDDYVEVSSSEDEDDMKDWVWHCCKEDFSYSISDRKTNGFYEIDMDIKIRCDYDGEKHKSFTIYYDGEQFVERENKTSE